MQVIEVSYFLKLFFPNKTLKSYFYYFLLNIVKINHTIPNIIISIQNFIYKVYRNFVYKLGREVVENIVKNHNYIEKHGWKSIGGSLQQLLTSRSAFVTFKPVAWPHRSYDFSPFDYFFMYIYIYILLLLLIYKCNPNKTQFGEKMLQLKHFLN